MGYRFTHQICLPVLHSADYCWRMTESHIDPAKRNRRPRRWRYLIDIVVLVAVTFLFDAVLDAFIPAVAINLEKGFVLDAIGKMLLVGVWLRTGFVTW